MTTSPVEHVYRDRPRNRGFEHCAQMFSESAGTERDGHRRHGAG